MVFGEEIGRGKISNQRSNQKNKQNHKHVTTTRIQLSPSLPVTSFVSLTMSLCLIATASDHTEKLKSKISRLERHLQTPIALTNQKAYFSSLIPGHTVHTMYSMLSLCFTLMNM